MGSASHSHFGRQSDDHRFQREKAKCGYRLFSLINIVSCMCFLTTLYQFWLFFSYFSLATFITSNLVKPKLLKAPMKFKLTSFHIASFVDFPGRDALCTISLVSDIPNTLLCHYGRYECVSCDRNPEHKAHACMSLIAQSPVVRTISSQWRCAARTSSTSMGCTSVRYMHH